MAVTCLSVFARSLLIVLGQGRPLHTFDCGIQLYFRYASRSPVVRCSTGGVVSVMPSGIIVDVPKYNEPPAACKFPGSAFHKERTTWGWHWITISRLSDWLCISHRLSHCIPPNGCSTKRVKPETTKSGPLMSDNS